MWLGIVIAAVAAFAVVALGVVHFRRERGGGMPPSSRHGDASARIDAFWSWWSTAAPRIAAAFDQDRASEIAQELSARIDAIDRRLAWETGPGLKGARHHLALSSEGDRELRVLVERWLARAPPPDAAWEFYPARQPNPRDRNFALQLDGAGRAIQFAEVRIAWETDSSREVAHVTLHHPEFARLTEEARTTATFILLDNVLGEDGVERWLGRIDSSTEPLPAGKPLAELADAIASLAKTATGERFVLLEGRTPKGRPTIAVANVAAKRLDHLLMEHHLEIVVPYEEASEEGMPSPENNVALNELEDELLDALGHDAVYLGHETGDGRRRVHLHAAGSGTAEARTREWASRHPELGIELDLRYDPGWDVLRRW
jgi:hypothetical protein